MNNLTGRELDAAVAERIENFVWVSMGYTRFLMPQDMMATNFIKNPSMDIEIDYNTIPDYQENWNDLWRAILTAREKGIFIQFGNSEDCLHLSVFYGKDHGKDHCYNLVGSQYAQPGDVPTIICQLMLQALDEKEKAEKS